MGDGLLRHGSYEVEALQHNRIIFRFLIFNKKTHEWVTQKPLEVFPSMFVTHQLNAFENPDGTIVADMVFLRDIESDENLDRLR